MKPSIVLSLIVLFGVGSSTLRAHANDTSLEGAGGSWQPLKGENSSISMESESIQMDVYSDYCDTVVDFNFHNSGSATKVKMGFPEDSYPLDVKDAKKMSFLRFSTSVDGRSMPATRISTRPQFIDPGSGSHNDPMTMTYSGLWVKEVAFARNQTRRVRVSYRSRFSSSAIGGASNFLTYLFTGKNWKGTVKESRLKVTLREPGYYLVYDNPCGAPQKSRSGSTWNFKWTNWQAQGTFMFWFTRTTPQWMTFPNTLQIYNGSDLNTNDEEVRQLLQEVTVSGKSSTSLLWYPDMIERNGVVYANIQSLASSLEQRRPTSQFQSLPISFVVSKSTASLRVGDTKLSFYTDQNKLKIEDGDSVALPSVPFCLVEKHTWGWAKEFYVPLEPTIKALGGNVWINRQKRRAYYELDVFQSN